MQRGHRGRALRGIAEIDGHEPRAMQIARLAPRQCHDLTAAHTTEVPQGGASNEPGRACNHDLLACHRAASRQHRPALISKYHRLASA
jgi:hypothetical protein